MLGYESKEELLSLEAGELNADGGQKPVLGRNPDDRGGVRAREIALRRKDGGTVSVLDTSGAAWDASGKIVRYQGTLVDVTEQRAMEKALRRQEEFQRDLLESFPDLILVIDLNGRYSFVSSRIRDLLGCKPEDFLGKKIEELPDHSPELFTVYRDVSSGKKRLGTCEYGARHRDGSLRTMRASASPLFGTEERVSGVIVSVHDITLEKKMDAADHSDRTAGGDRPNDRRLCARAEQSSDQHFGGGGAAAGQPYPGCTCRDRPRAPAHAGRR